MAFLPRVTPGRTTQRSATIEPAASVTFASSRVSEHRISEREPNVTSSPTTSRSNSITSGITPGQKTRLPTSAPSRRMAIDTPPQWRPSSSCTPHRSAGPPSLRPCNIISRNSRTWKRSHGPLGPARKRPITTRLMRITAARCTNGRTTRRDRTRAKMISNRSFAIHQFSCAIKSW